MINHNIRNIIFNYVAKNRWIKLINKINNEYDRKYIYEEEEKGNIFALLANYHSKNRGLINYRNGNNYLIKFSNNLFIIINKGNLLI